MPWIPSYPGEFPSLGWIFIDWAQTYLRVPAGDREGERLVFTDTQKSFFVNLFRVQEPYGESLFYRRAARIGPKATGKSPTGGILALGGVGAPIVPCGFDAYGQPVGRRVKTPLVQIAGVSEDSAGNVYALLETMVGIDGPLHDALPGLDVGKTRITLKGRDVIRPVSSNGSARQGQPVTLGVLEESQEMRRGNGGQKLATILRGNCEKTAGLSVELSNAPEPGENSVAERTIEGWLKGGDGRAGVFLDMPQPSRNWDWDKPEERRAGMLEVYGDTADVNGGWVPFDRIVRGTYDASYDLSFVKRMFGNIMVAGSGAWLTDLNAWTTLTDDIFPAVRGDVIAMGFDGARTGDSTVLRGCRISDGHLFTLGMWEKPTNPDEAENWEVRTEWVNEAVEEAMEKYKVLRFYADPPYWQNEIGAWSQKWGGIVYEWPTRIDSKMSAALERLHTAIVTGEDISHDDDGAVAIHYGNAIKKVKGTAEQPVVLIRKETPYSTRKIDAVVTDALAYEARGDVIANGEQLEEDKPAGYYGVYDWS